MSPYDMLFKILMLDVFLELVGAGIVVPQQIQLLPLLIILSLQPLLRYGIQALQYVLFLNFLLELREILLLLLLL